MSTISAGTTLTTALVQTGDTTGELVIKTNNGNTTAATFTSAGNVGIGTSSPSYKLDVAGLVASQDAYLITANSSGVPSAGAFMYRPATNTIALGTNSTERMRLDSSGNLGLGVTPSAWYSTGYSALQVKGSSLYSTSGNDTNLISNAFLSTSPAWTYISTAAASRYEQVSGQHRWHTAPSGTAGNAITFTQAMTLDASGNLGIGTASPQNPLHINGTSTGYARFQSSNRTYTIGSLASAYGFVINDVDSGQQVMQIDAAGLFKFNSGYGSAATAYGCRAWVNFNGTGTVAIRGSGNVSSITDNGTGDYTVNFSAAMPDVNYSPVTTIKPTSGASSTNGKVANIRYDTNLATGSCRVWCNSTGGAEDMDVVSVAIFR